MTRTSSLFAGFALLSLFAFCACIPDGSDAGGPYYLSLRVDSALTRYDRVVIALAEPGGDTIENVWDAPLPDVSLLEKVQVEKYQGGRIDVVIRAFSGEEVARFLVVHYTDRRSRPRIDTLPLPDYAPPVIALGGPEIMHWTTGSGAFRDPAACSDDRDPRPRLEVRGAVDADSLGVYLLTYSCKDSSGNLSAARVRVVMVELEADLQKPVIDLHGPANFSITKGGGYAEKAACTDARDPHPTLSVSGKVGVDSVASYALVYRCVDSAGNEAEPVLRVVNVTEATDIQPPVIDLKGPARITLLKGTPYVEKAVCIDGQDPKPVLTVAGSVYADSVGAYALDYACKDASGNAALARTRMVSVVRAVGSLPPILTLIGPSFLTLSKGQAFSDPPASCLSGAGDTLAVKASGEVRTGKVGVYLRAYTCVDTGGRVARSTRQIAVEEPSAALPALKEASMDTNYAFSFNNGSDGTAGFSAYSNDDWISILQFDMSRVRKEGLVSAKAVFKAFGLGRPGDWTGKEVKVIARVSRLTHPWIEGNGNWYYHDGAWSNGGDVYYSNYAMRPEVLQGSLDPAVAGGESKNDLSEFRPDNLISVGDPQPVFLKFTEAQTAFPGEKPIPGPEALAEVEFDLTQYVRNSPGVSDYGLLITLEGLQGKGIRYLTKEIGDGSLGPKLILSY